MLSLELYYKHFFMFFLLPFIALAAANPCPYCKWGSCSFTPGSLPNCSACYDIAALIPVKIPATVQNSELSPLGVCQLCPDHCGACQYQFVIPNCAEPTPIINCTSCYPGYTTHHFSGKCERCPMHCQSCMFAMLILSHSQPAAIINCTKCDDRYTSNYTIGTCLPCPDNCTSCQCLQKMCTMVSCTVCDSGFVTNTTVDGWNQCVPAGERRLFEEQPEKAGQGGLFKQEEDQQQG